MQAVKLEYELGCPLDALPAATPFGIGTDVLRLLAITGDLEQFNEDKPRSVLWKLQSIDGRTTVLRASNELDVAARAGLSVVRGLRAAEAEAQLPSDWSLAAGRKAAAIAERLGDSQETGLHLRLVGDETDEAAITRQTKRNLQSATQLHVQSYGSVVGVLGRLTAYKQRRAALWSDLDGRRIEVRFQEQHTEDMRAAWAHAHVEVTGIVHENAAGQALKIDAVALDVLQAQPASAIEGLPRGLYPDMTGGLGAREYLRLLRGED